ncbi:hypothetical protein [Nostocoides sp. Soil756]|uniref:hypothetical protein n=1 Tax=Nostocoides sp. Soil756 TaxID=1736399 RepID=UPI000701771D|nr:hypothetical protein [Tetrasphaera sp. Soil756]KRE61577.1 hypothetical protein ASG78_09445 [Tetrasphaera sp. Soil756]
MSTLLRDVIDIPKSAGAEDYVLRLTDSVGEGVAARVIDDYVVTDAIADAFDGALGLVAEAITSGISRGAFLTGSFGSGKSHFMAVLHALLRHETVARSKGELQHVIAKHDGDLYERKILPLAFHLLGAKTMEQALFDGYIRQIRGVHPDAPLPAVHKSDALLDDAERMRGRLGDQGFFEGLNGGGATETSTGEADPWANLLGGGAWDRARYDEARAASAASETRQQLVSALVETYFGSYTQQAEYVDLDTGLAAISTHAKGLGYDAVVLFLDELVLWLAFAVQDREFFRRESQKLTKLVESAVGGRAIPLVSFVARQMDLRRWFADSGASGAEQEALDRAFRHQEGRFGTIVLGDDNLPFVANRRLLRPKDAEARQQLETAFRGIDRREAVWDVLLDGVNTDESHRGADEEAFRLTYPFSPALVSTLRSLASVMQRERTALKVMQQMLVDRRNTLTIDEVLPVGDSFDLVVQGQTGQALDAQAAALFRSANKLYTEKLRPLLLANHNLDERAVAERPESVPPAFRTDDRLAKTLLLSAVAPNVPALKSLTAARLASLNHGSIVSPLPGGEAALVLSKIRAWARDVPEIHLDGEDRNPTIRVQLSDVDYESVVERAKGEDNEGRRRELLKDIVSDGFGVSLGSQDIQGAYPHEIIWRGSRRRVDLVFGNVRDRSWLSDDHFINSPDTWRVVIDHPFDDAGHSSVEDVERLEGMLARGFEARTIVWLPKFLSDAKITELRRLTILNWLLDGTGERWRTHADHLNEADRALARSILESQRNTLRRSLEDAVQQAYGAASPRSGVLLEEDGHDRVLTSLDRSFAPANPVGATLSAAFEHLLHQAMEATYPAHPAFEPGDVEVKVRDLKLVAAHIARAVADKEKRVDLQGDIVTVRRVANPLGVGTATEMSYILGDDRFSPWGQEIERALGRREQETGVGPLEPVKVAELRGWIDAVRPAHGLRPEVADLVIITWAALRQRAWFAHGAALATVPDPGQLTSAMELRTQPMPTASEWSDATASAGALLGVSGAAHLTAPAVADFVGKVVERATALTATAPSLTTAVEAAYQHMGLSHGQRLDTARRSAELVQQLRHLSGVELVRRIGSADLGGATPAAAGTSLASAEKVGAALNGFEWSRLAPLFEAIKSEADSDGRAAAVVQSLLAALQHDELVAPVAKALKEADDGVFAWLASRPVLPPKESDDDRVVDHGDEHVIDTARFTGKVVAHRADEHGRILEELRAFLAEHPEDHVEVTWRVVE